MFVTITIRSHDALNGRQMHVHPDDIRLIMPDEKVYNEKIPMVGEKPELVNVVVFASGRMQGVHETYEQIKQGMDQAYQERAWANGLTISKTSEAA